MSTAVDWWAYTPCACGECGHRPLANGTNCRCPQCQPGDGIDFRASALGPVVKIVKKGWCAICQRNCVVVSTRADDGSWKNCCDELHVWTTY